MSYFADTFDLNILGAIQPQPGASLGQGTLLALTRKCGQLPERQKQLVLIAVEPQYPEDAAKLLKKQLDKAGIKQVDLVNKWDTSRPPVMRLKDRIMVALRGQPSDASRMRQAQPHHGREQCATS